MERGPLYKYRWYIRILGATGAMAGIAAGAMWYLNEQRKEQLLAELDAMEAEGIPTTTVGYELGELPDDENAVVLYEEARRKLGNSTTMDEEVRGLFLEASERPESVWIENFGIDVDFSRGAKIVRDLTDVALRDAEAAIESGRPEEGWRLVHGSLHAANSFRHEPALVNLMMRAAFANLVVDSSLNGMEEGLPPEPLRRAIRHQLSQIKDRSFVRNALEGETALMGEGLRWGLDDMQFYHYPVHLAVLGADFQGALLKSMRQSIQMAESPHHAWPAELASYMNPSQSMRNVIEDMHIGNLIRVFESVDEMMVRADYLLLGFALIEYREDHGSFPESLEALVPGYMNELPVDPFAGKAYEYQRINNGFELQHGKWHGIPTKINAWRFPSTEAAIR